MGNALRTPEGIERIMIVLGNRLPGWIVKKDIRGAPAGNALRTLKGIERIAPR